MGSPFVRKQGPGERWRTRPLPARASWKPSSHFSRLPAYNGLVAKPRTRLYSSQGRKPPQHEASDILYGTALGGAVVSAMAEPSGEEADLWLLSKAKGLGVEGSAVLLTEGVTHALKITTDRTRPNGENQSSFPSGHASGAFALATLTSRNLDSLSLPDGARLGLQATSYAVAGSVAWARVEAHKHFPSDVLAGAAIGHFISAFIHDAFLELPQEVGIDLEIGPVEREAMLAISWSF